MGHCPKLATTAWPGRVIRRCGAAMVLAGLSSLGATTAFARAPGPVLRLPLEDYDYQPLPAVLVNAGASALTLHYVDGRHLLLTFSRRRLLARLPDDPPTDFDRNVDAVLLELPTGKVLAKTSWRLHDADQYLWPLPNGNFLLRERNRLVTIAPLEMLGRGGDAFAFRPFAASSRRIAAIMVSPSYDLLTLETKEQRENEPPRSASPGTRAYAAAASAGGGEATAEEDTKLVQVDFFRVKAMASAGGELRPVHAGVINARSLVALPVDATGLLTSLDQGRGHWAFDFHHHDGKVDELSPFDSSCRPVPMMVSRSEFIAFGCRGGQDRKAIGGFNLRGEEMWEQSFVDSFTRPQLAFAPGAGRFALARMVTGTAVEQEAPLSQSAISAESVSVYQTESGRVLLNMTLTPVLQAGQNFALSPDGAQLAVANNGAIEIYALPEETPKEQQAVRLADTLVPPQSEAPIKLEAIRERVVLQRAEAALKAAEIKLEQAPVAAVIGKPASSAAGAAAESSAEAATTSRAAAANASAAGPITNGDAVEGEGSSRKAPTLYAPGEPHDGSAAKTTPQ